MVCDHAKGNKRKPLRVRQALTKVGIWFQPRRIGFQALSAGCIVNAKKFVDRGMKNFALL
jgi:hypothetical protein